MSLNPSSDRSRAIDTQIARLQTQEREILDDLGRAYLQRRVDPAASRRLRFVREELQAAKAAKKVLSRGSEPNRSASSLLSPGEGP